MKRKLAFLFTSAMIVASISAASADYTIFLKNGRQVTVQNFREEGSMIKFHGYGGEISIAKNQILAIRPVSEVTRPEKAPSQSTPPTTAVKQVPPSSQPKTAPQVVEEKTIEERRIKEEEAYQQQLKKINNQLQELRGRYATETRGNTGSDPVFFTTEEAFRGHQEDLLSRLRDAQYKAQGLPSGRDQQSPPFSTNPPPAYTEKQKLLSDLRNQLNELEIDRQRVIAEMKQNKFNTDSFTAE